MFHKVLRSAAVPEGMVNPLPLISCGAKMDKAAIVAHKAALWTSLKAANPLVIVTFGLTLSRLLLRGGPSMKLVDVVAKPHRPDYLPPGTLVVPGYQPSYLLRRGKGEVGQAVSLWKSALRYCERNQ